MAKRVKRYINKGFVLISVTCVTLFIFMAVYMAEETKDMADEVSNLYMSEINHQMQQKFDTIIGLRAAQLEGIIERTPPQEENWSQAMVKELKISAEVRDFVALGLYRNDGIVEMIHGEEVNIEGDMTVNCHCEEQLHMIQLATDSNGEMLLLLGRVIGYTMSDGQKSDVIFATLPLEYFNEAMYLDVPKTQITTHIIDSNGKYLIKNGDAKKYSDIYERIEADFSGVEGKETEDYIKELGAALSDDVEYSAKYKIAGVDKRLYISQLTDGLDWYIMTVIRDEDMNALLRGLNSDSNTVMLVAVIVIIVVMLWFFQGYYKRAGQQMKELYKARKQAEEANQAKSRFLTSMSHDIRTPMNAIIGMSDIAIKNIDNPEKATACLRKVQLSGKHLLGLINDILDMSSIESGKLTIENKDVALHQFTSECVDIIQPQIKAKNQTFDVFVGDIIAEHVYSDDVRMSQILLNLLSNATKYTLEGGRIYLHIYQEQSSLGDDYVRTIFEVEDNGIGMSEEFLEQIFDRFAREDKETVRNISGSGLGMAITKSIVDLMDGTIEVKSKVNQGTTFRVVLDIKRAEIQEQDMKLPAWKVLVVDDNEQLCCSAADTLEELGLVAEWTQDGMEAVRMVEDHHQKNDDYHFALIDWKMPNMDGIETIKEIRKRIDADIPMFIISAYSQTDVEHVLNDTEIAGFISKPLFKSNLYMHFVQYLNHEVLVEKESTYMEGLGQKTLLLAEDNDINAEIVVELLSEYGIKIDRAENGRDCVEKFAKSEIGHYGAVFMDVHMPIMDGYEATRKIRAMGRKDSKLPIIAMTADAFSDNMDRCMESGMNECVTKPIDVRECVHVLKKYL